MKVQKKHIALALEIFLYSAIFAAGCISLMIGIEKEVNRQQAQLVSMCKHYGADMTLWAVQNNQPNPCKE